MRSAYFCLIAAIGVLGLAPFASAEVNLPGENLGTDCAFTPTGNYTFNLANATTGDWDTDAGPEVCEPGVWGNGVYDPQQWAVFFKFSEVSIPPGVTVSFTNHPSGAPVIWLVNGDVFIGAGAVVNLDGSKGHDKNQPSTFAEPGPGGFRGGRATPVPMMGSGGFGPGGGQLGDGYCGGSAGGYGTAGAQGGGGGGAVGAPYGSPGVFPLIGGSGGAGARHTGSDACGGGAGGGAILIVSSGTITLSSDESLNARAIISADGGSTGGKGGSHRQGGGGGSGGGIRLVGQALTGGGLLSATGGSGNMGDATSYEEFDGGTGGSGRIRIEVNDRAGFVGSTNPLSSDGLPGQQPRILRDFEQTPSVRSVELISVATAAATPIGIDPSASMAFPHEDVQVEESGQYMLRILVEQLPVDTNPEESTIQVRVVRADGPVQVVEASFDSGTATQSTWYAPVDLTDGMSAVDVRVILPEAPAP